MGKFPKILFKIEFVFISPPIKDHNDHHFSFPHFDSKQKQNHVQIEKKQDSLRLNLIVFQPDISNVI